LPFSSSELDGQVAVMTGAGSGIGRAALTAFLAAGVRVSVLEQSAAKCAELRQLGPGVTVTEGDATLADAHAAAVEAARAYGPVSLAISFVGTFDHYLPLAGIPEAQFDAAFDEMFAVNVKSALLLARSVVPDLRRSRGTLILTLSSSSFFPGRGGPLYVASKHALRGVVLQLAHELAPEVRVNGVAPGGTVSTDLRGLSALGQAGSRLDDRPGRKEQIEARTPLGTALSAADHAACYLFLASAGAAGMTGQILSNDGGLSVR
jgi:NAD(P)-dependent dehydrogenase (short-subunit alcohol dehydrogenase family)